MEQDSSAGQNPGQFANAHLLDEKPIGDIQLEAFGPHRRIAEAIADLVRNDTGGKAIALEGAWGSGKSTVVELLKAQFAKSNCDRECSVFVFDSWSHRDDPLRRTFLESLHKHLYESKWINEENSKEVVDALKHNTEETHTQSRPVLTFWGRVFAVSLVFAVVGSALLGHLGFPIERVTGGDWTAPSQDSWVALFLSASPLIVIALAVLMRTCCCSCENLSRQNQDADQGFLPLLLQQTTKETRTKTIRTPNPTSIEFKDCFLHLVGSALDKEDRRLVIALDNLDRVGPEEALAVWATMRIFFDPEQVGKHAFLSKLWVVVPYDGASIRQLWRRSAGTDRRAVDSPTVSGPGPDETAQFRAPVEEQGYTIAESFLDKTFQARFFVPPPIPVSRREFFVGCMKRAFDDQSNDFSELAHRVYGIFENRPIEAGQFASPRDIKLFINQLVIWERQRPDPEDFPLPILAAYAVLEKDFSTGKRGLDNPDFLPAPLRFKLEEYGAEHSIRERMAAMQFNVELGNGLDCLYERRLREALSKGEAGYLELHRDIRGFADICAKVVEKEFSKVNRNQADLARAAKALVGLGNVQAVPTASAWQIIYKASKDIEQWEGIDEIGVEGLIELVRYSHQNEAKDHTKYVSSIVEAISHTRGIDSWTRAVVKLLTWLAGQSYDQVIRDHFRVVGDEERFAQIIRMLCVIPASSGVCKYFQPEDFTADVKIKAIESLNSSIAKGQFLEAYWDPIILLNNISHYWPWEKITGMVRGGIQSSTGMNAPAYLGRLQALISLSMIDNLDQADIIQEQYIEGGISHYLSKYKKGGDFRDKAFALHLFILLFSLPPEWWTLKKGTGFSGQEDLVRHMKTRLQRRDDIEPIEKEFARLVTMFGKQAELERIRERPENTAFTAFFETVEEQVRNRMLGISSLNQPIERKHTGNLTAGEGTPRQSD